jgi:hypothetical protein
MRVQPTTKMQGGEVARPLVAFQSSKSGHQMPSQDRALLDTAEAVRPVIDAQNASAWHKPLAGSGMKQSEAGSWRVPLDRPMTRDEASEVSDLAGAYGYPNVVDTGKGLTITNFADAPTGAHAKSAGDEGMVGILGRVLPDAKTPTRLRVEGGGHDYSDEWKQGVGSGAVTRKMLDKLDQAPGTLAQQLDASDAVPQAARMRMERDAEVAAKTGDPVREDIQNLRRIVGEGPGWQNRLKEALARGEILPALAAAYLGAGALQGDEQH